MTVRVSHSQPPANSHHSPWRHARGCPLLTGDKGRYVFFQTIFTECSVRSLYPGLDLGGSRAHNRKGTRGVSGKASTMSGLYLLELRVYARLSPFLGFHPSSRLSKAPTRNSLVTDPTRWLRDTDAAGVKVGYVSVRIGCQTMTLVVVTI